MTPFPLQIQAEWFWWLQHEAAHGTAFTREQAQWTLLDMAKNHDDDRLKVRAASIVVSRFWDNVDELAMRPEGGTAVRDQRSVEPL